MLEDGWTGVALHKRTVPYHSLFCATWPCPSCEAPRPLHETKKGRFEDAKPKQDLSLPLWMGILDQSLAPKSGLSLGLRIPFQGPVTP
jgi:hypothetical protein